MRGRLAKFALVSLLTLDLCPAASLAIHNAAVSEMDGGPAIASRQNFLTGETFYFTFQVTGFTKKTDEDERNHVELEYRVTLKDKAGLLLDKPVQGKINEELTPQDKAWLPKVNRSFVLPDTLVTAEYHLDIEVRDLTAKTSAMHQIKIPVRGGRKQPAKELVADEVRFFRDEDGKIPAVGAKYSPGAALHVQFQIAGFSLKENNEYEVSYGVKILRADGTVAFQQPDAAKEQDKTFYPRAYLHGAFNLTLDKNVAAGTYKLVIEMRDDLSGKKHVSEFPFHIE